MKKLFSAGAACTFAFSLALLSTPAHADDEASTANTQQQQDQNTSSNVSNPSDSSKSGGNVSSSTSVTHQQTTKLSKTCTDQSGVTFKAGESGFDKCMQQVKKQQKQMGGMAGKMGSTDQSSSSSDMNQ